jgi:hypothetical protein
MIKFEPKFTAEASVLAAIPIDMQAPHFFNPNAEDRI